ncbi:MAG: EamA family transporter [Anaeromyxobacter sp.]
MSARLRPTLAIVYLGVAVLWGSTWMVVRIGLDALPPLLFAGVRMALAAALLAPVALRGGHWREVLGPHRGRVAVVGLFQIALPYGLLFLAQQWVPSSLSAVLFATFPIWVAIVARLWLPEERLTPLRLLSVAVGIAGVVVLQAPHLSDLEASGRLAAGSALVVLASMVVAVANVVARRHLTAVSPLALTTGQTAVGGVLLLAASFALEFGRAPAAVTAPAVGALLYLAVFGTALTYLGLYWLIPRVSMAAIGALPLVDTTVAVLLGAAVLHEPVGWPMLAGGAMVLAAAGIAALPVRSARPAQVPASAAAHDRPRAAA